MKLATKTLLASATALAFTAGSADAEVLYQHTFDGDGSVAVNGLAVDVVAAGALATTHGITSTAWTESSSGTFTDDGLGSGQFVAELGFTPIDGTVYTITMIGTNTADSGNWISVGYWNNSTDNGSIPNGLAWSLFRTNDDNAFALLEGVGTILDNVASPANPATISIVLDTTDGGGFGGGAWDVEWYFGGSATPFASADNVAFSSAIVAVGVGSENAAADIDSFTLEVVPEPGSLALLGLGGLLVAARRRRD